MTVAVETMTCIENKGNRAETSPEFLYHVCYDIVVIADLCLPREAIYLQASFPPIQSSIQIEI